ncbi:accessory Sec-dependent LPXTG-anchored adhesin [Sesbania bispinosa]|nr:accessory Sec-dependent LPXTG-anchored adhesin [Sesbania bispinosa]
MVAIGKLMAAWEAEQRRNEQGKAEQRRERAVEGGIESSGTAARRAQRWRPDERSDDGTTSSIDGGQVGLLAFGVLVLNF